MTVAKRNKRMKPDPELVRLADSLLANYQKPEDPIGENGLLKQLTKMLWSGRSRPRCPNTWATARARPSPTPPATRVTSTAPRRCRANSVRCRLIFHMTVRVDSNRSWWSAIRRAGRALTTR